MRKRGRIKFSDLAESYPNFPPKFKAAPPSPAPKPIARVFIELVELVEPVEVVEF
jgi:hypothetical protein